MASGTGNAIFGNALLDAPVDPLVPELIDQAAATVQDYLNQNKTWASSSINAALAAMASLANANFPNQLPDPPVVVSATVSGLSSPGFNIDTAPNLGTLTPLSIEDFNPAAIIVPDISGEIPAYVSVIQSLSIPDAPTLVLPDSPDPPVLNLVFEEPTEPVADYGTSPVLDELNLPVYIPPVLPLFTATAPTFTTQPPDLFVQWQEPVYASQLPEVESVLESMLAGGTGLPAAVETAIWERGLDRETLTGLTAVDQAAEEFAARGFALPPGRLNAMLMGLRDATQLKLNELSREVMVEQAKLEQANRQFAVTQGINYEQLFVNLFLAVTQRNFEIAKFQIETAIQVYNMQVTAFNVEHQVFVAKIELFRAQLEAAFANIKAFTALVEAEKAKAEINVAKVQAFEAKIKAFVAQVGAFDSLIKAQIAKAEFEKNKVEVYKAQIEGQVAQIQGQREVFNAYGERVKAEAAKAQLEEANAQAYTARVRGIGEKAQILIKQADAEIAGQRLDLDWAVARLTRMGTFAAQELNGIQARLAAFQGTTSKAVAKFDAESHNAQAQFQSQVELARVEVSRFAALLGQWDARARQTIALAEINAASLRAAGQIASNLAAGAMAGTHVSAGISGSASAGQSSTRSAGDSTSKGQTYNETFNKTVT